MPRCSHKTKSYKTYTNRIIYHSIKHCKLSTILQTQQQLQMHVYLISVHTTIKTFKTIHHSTNTATAVACIQDFCTAITMQCFSYAIRSQSVLTTIKLGVSTVFSTATYIAYHERDSFHSLLTQFLWTCAAIL